MKLKCKNSILFWLAAFVILLWVANGLMKFVVNKPIADCGTFGDQFGAVNALFSGLAFVGLIYTIIQQNRSIELQRKDLKNQLRELQQNGKEMIAQTKQFEKQNESMNLERFENRFFQMLQTHHDNVMSMKTEKNQGRDCFVEFVTQLQSNYSAFNDMLTKIACGDIYFQGQQEKLVEIIKAMDSATRKDFVFAMAYGHLFYGSSYKTSYKKDSDLGFLSRMINGEQKGFSTGVTYVPRISNIARSSQLGHYFRHLMMMVKYVDRQYLIPVDRRYEYVKMIRAQMSDYEQVLLYYNSISPLGKQWVYRANEYDDDGKFVYSLLIKYRLIKNIPHFFNYFYFDPRERFKEELSVWEATHEDRFFEQLEQLS